MRKTAKIQPVTRVPAGAHGERQAMILGVSDTGFIITKITEYLPGGGSLRGKHAYHITLISN